MKLAIKLAIAGTALVAGAANAANIQNGGTVAGGSDLVLFVTDTNTAAPAYYLKDLGVQMDSLGITKAQTASDPDFNVTTSLGSFTTPSSLGFTADAGIASFISQHSADNLVYSIMAVDATGTNNAAGARRILGSFNTDNAPASEFTSGDVSGSAIGTNTWFGALNQSNVTFPNNANGFGGGQGNGANAPTFFGSFNVGSAVGDTMTLFELATHGNGNDANIYESANTIKLTADGTLTVGVSSVPLPAAVWLLGSGLLGLCGVGRRRAA